MTTAANRHPHPSVVALLERMSTTVDKRHSADGKAARGRLAKMGPPSEGGSKDRPATPVGPADAVPPAHAAAERERRYRTHGRAL